MKLPGLKRYYVGKEYYAYHRAKNIPLPAHLPEDHEEFLEAYFNTTHGTKPPAPPSHVKANSIEDVAKRYLASDGFAALSQSFRDVRRRDIDRLRRQNDGAIIPLRIAQVRDIHIIADMDRLPPDPANERLKTW